MSKRFKWTIETVKKRGFETHGDKYNYDKVPHNLSAKLYVPIVCIKCNNEFMQNMDSHIGKSAGCPTCAGNLRYTREIFIRKAIEIHKDNYSYIKIPESKLNIRTKVPITCNKCSLEFLQRIDDHINGKHGCSQCGSCMRYTWDIFVERARVIHNNKYDYNKIPDKISAYSKVLIKCNNCLCEFPQTISAHINGQQGCPKCNRSQGELIIGKYLTVGDLDYTTEFIIASLPRKRFDFSVNEYKYLIEYDGIQHFEYVEYFHKTLDVFEDRKQVDIIKTVEALRNGYTLIRISYNIVDINKYLDFAFNGNKKLYLSDKELYAEHEQSILKLIPDISIQLGM
jgi:Zn finger protein HypA/HybF involved in hydrogenase expression